MNKGKISMSIQWSTEKLKQWRGEIEREKMLIAILWTLFEITFEKMEI